MPTRTRRTVNWSLVTLLLTMLCACSSSVAASTSPRVDPAPLATSACTTVDGAAHVELSPDIGAQLDAAAVDREAAVAKLSQAAATDAKYQPLSQDMATLATQSRGVANDYKTDPAGMAQRLLGANGGLGAYTSALVATRSACQALTLPTK